jgi:hypothetical protein
VQVVRRRQRRHRAPLADTLLAEAIGSHRSISRSVMRGTFALCRSPRARGRIAIAEKAEGSERHIS